MNEGTEYLDKRKIVILLRSKEAIAGVCGHLEREGTFEELAKIIERMPGVKAADLKGNGR